MNETLQNAAKWLAELNIKTELFPNCLKVCKKDLLEYDTQQLPQSVFDFWLAELREAMNSKKLFWANQDDNWLYLESF